MKWQKNINLIFLIKTPYAPVLIFPSSFSKSSDIVEPVEWFLIYSYDPSRNICETGFFTWPITKLFSDFALFFIIIYFESTFLMRFWRENFWTLITELSLTKVL